MDSMTFLGKYSEHAYAALRIVAGLLFMFHGVQKIFGVLTPGTPPMFSQVWIGGVIELVGGALIAVGLATRPAAFLASGTMAVAYFQFHWKFAGGAKVLPVINQGEPAVLYCFIFLLVACAGGGRFSLDQRLGRDQPAALPRT